MEEASSSRELRVPPKFWLRIPLRAKAGHPSVVQNLAWFGLSLLASALLITSLRFTCKVAHACASMLACGGLLNHAE